MKKICKRVIRLLKPYKGKEIIGIILTFMFAVSVFLVPKASGYLIDDVILCGSKDKLWIGIALFTAICFLQPIFGCMKDIIFTRITENITYDIRQELFNKIVYTDYSFFDSVKSGELISIIMNDGRGVSDFISKIFASLLKNISLVIMIIVGMLTISIKITVVVLCCFTIFYFGSMIASKKLRALSKNIQENYDEICSCVNQTSQAIISIKAYNQQQNTIEKYNKIIQKMKKDNIRINTVQILINNFSSVIVYICLAIIYGWGALCVINHTLTTGQIIAMGLYFQLLEQPFYELMNIGLNINVIMPIFDRLDRFYNLPCEKLGEIQSEVEISDISINHLNFKYKCSASEALRDIVIHFPKTGFVGIMGQSGSGKSTFIKVFMGIYQAEKNKIFWGNTDVQDISLKTIREMISYVPQESEIINDTIYNNICYGKENVSYQEIEELCKKLNLSEKINSLPDGYNSMISERVNLSGGERQRILIARGIIKDAPIIILDEPYSALDRDNIINVHRILKDLSQEKLIIMVTHYECSDTNWTMKVIFKNGRINKIIDNNEKERRKNMEYIVRPSKIGELAFCNCTCNGGNCNCKAGGGSYDNTNTSTVK